MWITVFKAGTHVNNGGVEQNYTEADLLDIANAYNNQPAKDRHTAPLIPGDHDKIHFSDGDVMIKPSMGWVEQLKVSGQNLLALIDPTPKFTEAVKGKYYNKLSISLKANKLLDHIALLGSVKPALKGLPNLDSSFTMNVKDLTDSESYEFSSVKGEPPPPLNDNLKPKENYEEPKPNLNNNQIGEKMTMSLDTAKLIEWVKTEFGDETATKLQAKLPEFEVKEDPKPEEGTDLSEPTPPTPPADFSESDKEKIALQNRIAILEAENRMSKFSEFVGTTHLPVGLKSTALNVLEIAHSAETSNFSVKDEAGKDTAPTNVMKALLKSWPETITLGADPEVNGSNFSEPGGKGEEITSATDTFNKSRK